MMDYQRNNHSKFLIIYHTIFVVQLETLQSTLYGGIFSLKANKPGNSSPELKTQGFSCRKLNKFKKQ